MALYLESLPDGLSWPRQSPQAVNLDPLLRRRLDLDTDLTRALGDLLPADLPWPAPCAGESLAVLDLPGGAGCWSVLLARRYGDRHVVCADPSPALLTLAADFALLNGCFNLTLQPLCLEQSLPFEGERFALVHLRCLSMLLTGHGWRRLLTEAVRVLAPGGLLLLEELDRPLSTGPATSHLVALLTQARRRAGYGVPPPPGARSAEERPLWPALFGWLQSLGLQALQWQERLLSWQHALERPLLAHQQSALLSLAGPWLTQGSEPLCRPEEVLALCQQLQEEQASPGYQLLLPLLQLWGRK